MAKGTWLYTRDGDLDPLWLFLGAHLLLGVVLVAVAAFHGGQAFLAALAYNAVSVLALAIIKVPIDRARLLAPALPKAMGALQAATSPPYAGMDQDERGPDDRDATWD
jgi:hypothetical protein